jgi:hypothetical protein
VGVALPARPVYPPRSRRSCDHAAGRLWAVTSGRSWAIRSWSAQARKTDIAGRQASTRGRLRANPSGYVIDVGASVRVLQPRHDGQNTCCFPETCQGLAAKINLFAKTRNSPISPAIPRLLRRAFRERHETWCGERWTQRIRRRCASGAYSEVAWSWSPDAGIKRMEMRFRPYGRNAEIHSRRRLTSPDSGESAL